MNCGSCGRAHRTGARFCGGCGKPLVPRCPACGAENEPDAQFCDACGAALVARPEPSRRADNAEARKVVTIVFADLIGSTALHERLDAESARRVMDRYYRALRAAVEAHGGTVVKLLGDGVMAAFGVPRVTEDDAIRAVRAAIDMQHAFRELVHEQSAAVGNIGLRVAVNTGEVVVSADHDDVVGDPVNVAARLQQEAHDGDVLIGESTRRLVSELVTLAPFGELSLKGRSETVAAYRVVSLDRPAGAAATAFVGRDDELRRIMAAYDAAVTERRARLAVILGSPGLGKSRLLDEFARRLGDDATVLTARCDATGSATFAPIAKAVRALLRIDDNDRLQKASADPSCPQSSGGHPGAGSGFPPEDRGNDGAKSAIPDALRVAIAKALPDDADRTRITDGIAALLTGTPASPEETFFVVRRFLTGLAAAKPVVLAIDDLQWAEPLLLDLVEHLVQWSTGVPLLVLVAARPELRDTRSSLARSGGLVSDVVTLAGLDAAAATRLAANVIGAEALPAAVAGRVLATSEGNPLFVGELVRMLVNDGALKREGDRWTTAVDLAGLDMPPTIHALLAARIERLPTEDRTVLERAAVVGRQFSRAAVAHLLPSELRANLDTRLESLRRSELIEPDASWFLGEPALRFHHGLTRDAAYRRVLKGTRAELHGRCAEWIEATVGETVEHDETIGWHLEQAHQHLRELGPIDAQGRTFGERAARYLAAAGRRALARDDLPVAANFLGRALDRLDDADPGRADLALDWCEALLSAGEVGPAARAIAELGKFIGDTTPALARDSVDVRNGPPFDTPPTEGGYSGRTVLGLDSLDLARSSRVGPVFSGAVSRDRLRAWHTCFAGHLAVLTDPQALRATADAVAAAADELASAGDAAGEAKAHSVHATALARLGKIGPSEAALDRALAAARRAHDRRRSNAVLAGAPLAALWGPSPVTRASGRCLDVVRVLRITQGAPAVEAVALRCQGVLEALRGRTDAARRMLALSRRMVEELGITQRLLEADVFAGLIELIEGDALAAERCLRSAYDGLRQHGLGIDAAQAAALLGRALLAQGRADEAEALSHESEALAGDDLKAAIAWRGIRAEALARRGEHTAAVDFARAAVAIAAATDALLDHADARLALAVALRAAGRSGEAGAEEARAIELWEAKGATLLADRARRDAHRVRPADRTTADRAEPAHAAQRRIRLNAATAEASRLETAVATRDADALVPAFADLEEVVEHATGAVFDGRGMLTAWRSLLQAEAPTLRHEWLATLGDSLALCRSSMSFRALAENDVAPFGAVTREEIVLIEVGASRRHRRLETFAPDRLGDAIARLYERYADLLPDGSARERAAVTARSVATILGPPNLDRFATVVAPGIELFDHRRAGMGAAHGAEAFLHGLRALLEIADDIAASIDDVLGLRSNVILARRISSGTGRGCGPFERHLLVLCVFGIDGLVTRNEQFDIDREDEALARFDELVLSTAEELPLNPSVSSLGKGRTKEGSSPAARFTNAASRSQVVFERCWHERDWDGVVASFVPTHRMDDRRALFRMQVAGDDWLANLRMLFETAGSRWHTDLLATRGERLALLRARFTGQIVDGGLMTVDHLALVELDAGGRRITLVVFDPDDLDAAYDELDQHYAAGEATPHARVAASMRAFHRAFASRDWTALAAQCAPDLVVHDHRLLGWETLHGPTAYLEALRSLVELAPDTKLRLDHVTMSDRGYLVITVWDGTREGGAYEAPSLMVAELDGHMRIRRFDQYDLDRLDEARARFDPVGASGPSEDADASFENGPLEGAASSAPPGSSGSGRDQARPSKSSEEAARAARDPLAALARFAELRPDPLRIPPNAATRTNDRWQEAFETHDWDALRTLCAPAMVFDDRRANSLTIGDRDLFMASSRRIAASGARVSRTLLQTAGERVALEQFRWTAAGPGSALTAESLTITQVDAEGRFVAVVAFDPVDRRTAGAEMVAFNARSEVGRWLPPAALDLIRALNDHDLKRCRAALPDDYVFYDHRRTGLGRIEGADAYVASLPALFDWAPDLIFSNLYVVATNKHGQVAMSRMFGRLADGGEFESFNVRLTLFRGDQVACTELFEPEDVDIALARLEELRADPLRIPPNAATRASDRMHEAFAARDWDALGSVCAPALVLDDRRRATRTIGDRDMFMASSRLVFSRGTTQVSRTLLATSGDRLALERVCWIGTGDPAFEVEALSLIQVDAEGRMIASVLFDPDSRRAASLELVERYARSDAGRWMPLKAVEFRRALAEQDLDGLRAAVPDEFFFHDHRRTGGGRIEGADAYVAWLGALFEQSPDAIIEPVYYVATEPHGFLAIGHTVGTNTLGGEFESVFVQLALNRGARLAGAELFEIEDLDLARERFEELRPNPLP